MVGTSEGLTLGLCPASSHLSQYLLDRPTEPGPSHPGTSLTSFRCAQRPLLASGLLLTQAGGSPVSSAPLSSRPTFNQVPPQCPSAFSSGWFPLTFLQPSLRSLMTWISSHQAPLAQPPDASRELQTSSGKAHPGASFPRQCLPTDMHSHVDTLTDMRTYIQTHSCSHTDIPTNIHTLTSHSFIHTQKHTTPRAPSYTHIHAHAHRHACTHTPAPRLPRCPPAPQVLRIQTMVDFSPNGNCSGQAGRI